VVWEKIVEYTGKKGGVNGSCARGNVGQRASALIEALQTVKEVVLRKEASSKIQKTKKSFLGKGDGSKKAIKGSKAIFHREGR